MNKTTEKPKKDEKKPKPPEPQKNTQLLRKEERAVGCGAVGCFD